MSNLVALANRLRAHPDRNSLGNMRFFVPVRMPTRVTFAMGSNEESDKMPCLLIDPLINRFVADRIARISQLKSAGDKFGRPSGKKLVLDEPSNGVILESCSPMREAVSVIRPCLSFVGQVIPCVDRRGITLELSGEGAGISTENLGNLSKRLAFAFKDSEQITFMAI